ncbi:Uncharacterised protein [Lactobacillus rhamnosus]|uniref:Uncharacterized protein n=1 Tax=Lacticaseibacillus rhamnosus TaxID=47715 RepID=A0A6N3BQY5_LACRH|nr:hypothetical protein AMBR_NBBOBCOC_01624 [Lacticaseibacillus rhamnosus]VTU61558.1 hypothetical protein AMBR_EADFOONE_02147 [Lacticaseibacillus rhamnosus]VTU63176.1 hypothetical protein AMBR_BLFENHAL_01251 [Lacticaseibacillus rhamnosus]
MAETWAIALKAAYTPTSKCAGSRSLGGVWIDEDQT